MGKQSKRKGGRRRSGQSRHRPAGLADDPASTTTTANTSSENEGGVANVVKKIRHGDPRVRHAALVALSSTLYDSNSLTAAAAKSSRASGSATSTTSTSASANDPTLLRALSERILDPDVPCATTAAGCISNYVSFYTSCVGEGEEGSTKEEEINVASEVMVPILLTRIKQSLESLHTLGGQIEQNMGAVEKAVTLADTSSTAKKGTANSNTSSAVEKLFLSSTEQWSLLSLTLQTLAGLIENCPMAVQRMSGTGLAVVGASVSSTPNVFTMLLRVLPMSDGFMKFVTPTTSIDQTNATTGETEVGQGGKKLKQHRLNQEPILDASTNAARAMHSLLDDNVTLISSIPLGSPPSSSVASPSTAPTLYSTTSELSTAITNDKMLEMTRLHAIGAVLSLRRVLITDRENGDESKNNIQSVMGPEGDAFCSSLQSCTSDVVIPMLHSLFEVKPKDVSGGPREIIKNIMNLSNQLQSQKQDEVMESEIVQQINQKKEPARLIARRQKKLKEEKEQKLKEQQKDDKEMGMETETAEEGKHKEATPIVDDAAMVVEDDEGKDKSGDLKEELDSAVQSWRGLVGSYKLALELVANLCAGKEEEDENDADDGMYGEGDDDEHMWDSDDEAKLIAAAASNATSPSEAKCSPSDHAIYVAMATKNLPEQILFFFQNWVDFIPSLDSEGGEYPSLVVEDVNELLSTCALCLGNIIACDMPTWSAPAIKSAVMRGGNGVSVNSGCELFWWELVSSLSLPELLNGEYYTAKEQVALAMLSMLRHQPQSRTLVDSERLDLITSLLKQEPKNAQNKSDTLAKVQCHAIAMFGVLCSEPHPAEVDARVCSALMERVRHASTSSNDDAHSNVVIVNEIFNVLMDIYGGDECHDEIFEQQDVLGQFKRSLPWFKRQIRKMPMSGVSRVDTEIWNETALNISRFIKYKESG